MKTRQHLIPRERVGLILLDVDHNGEYLTFQFLFNGPETYAQVKEQIEQKNLEKPTMAQTASLVHAIFDSDGRYFNEVKDKLNTNWLWAFTGVLHIPEEGVYIQDDPETRYGLPFMKKSKLVRILEQETNKKVKTVRFVPFGYKDGEQTLRELEKNPYIVGLAGEDGAEKLAIVAGKFKFDPCLSSFNSGDKPEIKVSCLRSLFDSSPRLYIDEIYLGFNRDGFALGIQQKKPIQK